jgi:radical SAM superfamily enzyme YgiQ (UPF0313 family)
MPPKILFVKPRNDVLAVMPPLGLGYLSTALKRHGFATEIFDCNLLNSDIPRLAEKIRAENTKYVGITACSNEHNWLKKFCKAFENSPDPKIIVGGPHPTGLKARLFTLIPRIDFIVYSEGEAALPLLIKSLEDKNSDYSHIPNLIWKNGGEPVENPLQLPDDLDELGMPDWEQMSPVQYRKCSPHGGFSVETPVAQIISTRGCPYACEYCAGYLINGTRIRKRTAGSIIAEIEYLIGTFGVKEIHIEDDNFTFEKNHVLAFCDAVKARNVKVRFGLPNGIRLDRLDDEILSRMHECGFYFFSLGIESGSERILAKMHKALTVEKIRAGLKLIRKYPFQVKGLFMMGYPTETVSDTNETIRLATSLDLDQAFFSVFIPIPGTREFARLEKEGKVDLNTCDWDNFYSHKNKNPPFVPDSLSADELRKAVFRAFKAFYFRPKIAVRLLRRINSFNEVRVMFRLAKLLLGF